MKQVMILALVAIMSMTITSCMSVNIGNGDVDKTPTQVPEINQETAMQPFDVVDIVGPFKIVYNEGAGPSVRIEASEQELKEMTVYVKDGELRIRKAVEKPTVSFKNMKVYVSSPKLKKITLAGSGMFAASNGIGGYNDFDVEIAGSGQVLLASLASHNTDLEIAGSGNIEIGLVNANEVKADIAGSGNINFGVLVCDELKTEIAGSGDVNCDRIDAQKVHVEIAGSGDVNLKGRVNNLTKDIAGSGKVNFIEAPAPDKVQ